MIAAAKALPAVLDYPEPPPVGPVVGRQFLELLPPHMIVERISGDAPPDYFVGPTWCLDKPAVILALNQEMKRRDSWQGKRFRTVS